MALRDLSKMNKKNTNKSGKSSGVFIGDVFLKVTGYSEGENGIIKVKSLDGVDSTLKLYDPKPRVSPEGEKISMVSPSRPDLNNFGKNEGKDNKDRPFIGDVIKAERCFKNSDGSFASAYVGRGNVAFNNALVKTGMITIEGSSGYQDKAANVTAKVIDVENASSLTGPVSMVEKSLNDSFEKAKQGDGTPFVYLEVSGIGADGEQHNVGANCFAKWDKESESSSWSDRVKETVKEVKSIFGSEDVNVSSVPGESFRMVGDSLSRYASNKGAMSALLYPFKNDKEYGLYREGSISAAAIKADPSSDEKFAKGENGKKIYILTNIAADISSPQRSISSILNPSNDINDQEQGISQDQDNLHENAPDFGDVPVDDDIPF